MSILELFGNTIRYLGFLRYRFKICKDIPWHVVDTLVSNQQLTISLYDKYSLGGELEMEPLCCACFFFP